MTSIRNNEGSATILIMFMAGVIITVGLGFNWLVKEHIKSAEGLKNKADAILKARSAYDTLIYLMLNGQITTKEIVLLGVQDLTTLKSIPLNGKEVPLGDDIYARVHESNGFLSLYSIDRIALEGLFRRASSAENPAISVDSIIDWIDTDDFSQVNGAENSYYRINQAPYQARNYAIQYKEELALVRGIGRDLYRKVEPSLTILPTSGFNPNTASDEVLKAYLDLDDEALGKLKDYLSQGGLLSDVTLFSLTGRRLRTRGEEINFQPSRYMEITVRAGSPRSLYTIKAGLNFVANLRSPYSVLYWQEE